MNGLPTPSGPRAAFAKPISIETLREGGYVGAYSNRAEAVYWDRNTPACRKRGPGRAECLLLPNHSSPHYGNGYDENGPTGARTWTNTNKAVS